MLGTAGLCRVLRNCTGNGNFTSRERRGLGLNVLCQIYITLHSRCRPKCKIQTVGLKGLSLEYIGSQPHMVLHGGANNQKKKTRRHPIVQMNTRYNAGNGHAKFNVQAVSRFAAGGILQDEALALQPRCVSSGDKKGVCFPYDRRILYSC